MFWSIFQFEIRHHLRHPLLFITAGLLFLLAFGAVTSDTVQVGGAIGQVDRNAPFVIIQLLTVMSVLGIFVAVAFVASSILRDFELGTHELFFSRPVPKLHYLLGRFSGSLLLSLAVFLAPALGIIVGSLMPWLEPERLGPFMVGPYIFALLVVVLPNVALMAAGFFALAGMTRSMLVTYLGVIGTFVMYAVAKIAMHDLESQTLAAMLDPFGVAPLQLATKYWTIVERNSAIPEVGGLLLANRLLWLGVAAIFLAFIVWRFSYARAVSKRRLLAARRAAKVEESMVATQQPLQTLPEAPRRSFRARDAWRMLARQTGLEVSSVLSGLPFLVMLAFAVFNVMVSCFFGEEVYGTKVLPVTHLMLSAIEGSYLFMLMIIVTFYAGELIWKERGLKLAEVYDSLPAPSWVYLWSKLSALFAVVAAFTAVGVLCTMGYQLYMGYTRLEPLLYLEGVTLAAVPFLFVCVLAAAVQVAARSKFIGYLVMIVYLLGDDLYDTFHLDHHLYRFARLPPAPYSDMNGYGHFVAPTVWFSLYWAFFCAVLIGLCVLLWVRGGETAWAVRWRLARQRFTGSPRTLIAVGLVGFAATGAFIFYNTNVLNEYLPSDEFEARQADYEKSYRQYLGIAQPRVTAVTADVDIFPYQRRVEIRGRYRLVNRTDEHISSLHLGFQPEVTVNSLDMPEHTVALEDTRLGYRIYELAEALAPGAEIDLGFDLTLAHRGFVNHHSDTTIVRNGTFFGNRHVFPRLGYDENAQLIDRNARRRHGLEPVQRMAPVDDIEARGNTYIASDADWITFETTVSTSADQIALAPGYLQEEWQEGGRRYFHYAMDAPILNFFAYISADYTVRRDRWNDVEIAVYYHEPHDTNVDRMIDSVKKTLAYCSANFSPYQHRQVRIIEFPRYRRFAQSFPNTIPFSEGAGFIAKVDKPTDIDYVFDITSHEVAHQWWAHQVIGGNVQGATLMSEALAEYTSLMVMEHEYGPHNMRRFLKFELDRYLAGRGHELVEEMPLYLVENQSYIHYRKGSVVMYALRDYLGEEPLNQALARYVDLVGFQQPPYTNSLEFLDVLHAATPDEMRPVLHDMLETITLYSNRVEEVSYTPLDDGRYAVTLTVEAKKLRADGSGVETEVPIDDWIDIGVFGRQPSDGAAEANVLFLEKRRISQPLTTFELVVDEPPVRAGIDPFNKLIDRVSDDNVRNVKEATAT